MLRYSILALALVGVTAHAQIVVNSTSDFASNDGECTLREAILSSNTDQVSGPLAGECPAGNGVDEVTFALPAGSVITLRANLPAVTESWTLAGPTGDADGLTIDGADLYSALDFDGAEANPVFAVSGLTVRRGRAAFGGAILGNFGNDVELTNVALLDNTGMSGAGGLAIGEQSTWLLRGVLIRGNATDGNSGGGGIYVGNGADVTIENSTIAANATAITGGGGLFVSASSLPTTVRLVQSTVSGNESGGSGAGLLVSGPTGLVRLESSTIVENMTTVDNATGAGVWTSGTLTMRSSILAGNLTSAEGTLWDDLYFLNATFVTEGGSLIGNNSLYGTDIPAGLPNPNADYVGTNQAPLDAMLTPLGLNGGAGLTHVPLAGSLVIDAGICPSFDLDQRLMPREVDDSTLPNANGDACDIGAVEGTTAGVASENRPSPERIDVTLYPIPASHSLTVRIRSKAPRAYVRIVDMLGRTVAPAADVRLIGGESSLMTDVSSLGAGFYVIQIRADDEIVSRSFTVAR